MVLGLLVEAPRLRRGGETTKRRSADSLLLGRSENLFGDNGTIHSQSLRAAKHCHVHRVATYSALCKVCDARLPLVD